MRFSQDKNKGMHQWAVLMLIISAFFQSCGGEYKIEDILPESAGMPNEIYVFCDNEIWDDTIGAYMQQQIEYRLNNLPQPEERFTLFQFQQKGMNNARLTHRNIIVVEVNNRNENQKTRLVRKPGRRAKGQLRFEFKGQKKTSVLALLQAELPGLLDEISKKELERAQRKFQNRLNKTAQRQLIDSLSVKLTVPLKLNLISNNGVQSGSFAWLEAKGLGPEGKRVLHQGIFVYSYPYVSDSAFSEKYLIARRDTVLKQNVPGGTPNQYLKTLLLPGKMPESREINFNDKYAVEVRGQYTMHNGFMGGPFMSLTTLNESENRLVTVEAYCYAPLLKKRDYIKEMEAVVYSLKLTH
ncbi:MAG: DUF4837 family protein [Flavobacteriales bacterium]|nr:DUF4837 family protein [Flavobacteriales bacterium]